MDPVQAQAEINQFLAEQKSRKRTKMFMYSAVFLALVGVLGFFWLQSIRKEARVKEVYDFFTAYRGVDDETVAAFWKCTVRAKHRDVRLAKDTMEITEGLTKAFNNFPTSQPDHIKTKCVPILATALDEFGKLKPPEGFATPLESVKGSMKDVRTTFMTYADKIDERKGEAKSEQEVRNMANAFHMAHDNPDVLPKALEYYNILKCAIPDLDKAIKAIKKPPDTQPVVEYIYESCKKDEYKAGYADKLRKECFEQRKTILDVKDKGFKNAVYNMAGDNRDTMAVDMCFNETNKGFDYKELEAVAKVFIKYNNARGEILKPDAVFFGEQIPNAALTGATEILDGCRVMLVAGTSATVYPFASLPGAAASRGCTLVEVNLEPTPLTSSCDLTLHAPASESLAAVVVMVEELGGGTR